MILGHMIDPFSPSGYPRNLHFRTACHTHTHKSAQLHTVSVCSPSPIQAPICRCVSPLKLKTDFFSPILSTRSLFNRSRSPRLTHRYLICIPIHFAIPRISYLALLQNLQNACNRQTWRRITHSASRPGRSCGLNNYCCWSW